MVLITIANFLLAAFLGYLMGRFGDYCNDVWLNDPGWTPHHWIYGFILMTITIFYLQSNFGLWLFSFGAGLFVSDLMDFLDLKFIGKENKGQRKFWHIN